MGHHTEEEPLRVESKLNMTGTIEIKRDSPEKSGVRTASLDMRKIEAL